MLEYNRTQIDLEMIYSRSICYWNHEELVLSRKIYTPTISRQ